MKLKVNKMLELITIYNIGDNFHLGKVVVNAGHISTIREHIEYKKMLNEGKIDIGLDSRVTFSEIVMSTNSGFDKFIVIGSPNEITEKLKPNRRQILRD